MSTLSARSHVWLLLLLLALAACIPSVETDLAAELAQNNTLSATAVGPRPPSSLPTAPFAPTLEPYPPIPTASFTPLPYPWPTSTPGPTEEPTWTDEPTETVPPNPTIPPTPVVTPIPTAALPFLPFPEGTTAQPFTVYWRDGDVIRAISSAGGESRVFFDPATEFGLYLPPEGVSWFWGEVSPDGRRVALVLTEQPERGSTEVPHPVNIYILEQESRALRLLVKNALVPVWSPDGRLLAYKSLETYGLWVADVETGATAEIYPADLAHEKSPTDFIWASDNRHLALVDAASFQSYDLVVVDADGLEAPQLLIPGPMYWVSWPQWSPTTDHLTFVLPGDGPWGWPHHSDLWIMNPDGSGKRQLTQDISVARQQWSPDGRWIAFYGLTIFEPEPAEWDLWLIEPASGVLKRLTYAEPEATSYLNPMWSPDGTQLVFIKPSPEGVHEAWVLSLIDGSERKLVSPAYIKEVGLTIGP